MRLSDLDYDLPGELIAQEPAPRREDARLLVVHRATGTLEHRRFRDLPEVLRTGDRLVVNDTRVVPCRLFGEKESTGRRVELFVLNPTAGRGRFTALVRPARKLPLNTWVRLEGGARARVTGVPDESRRELELEGVALPDVLRENGHVPLPPYIRRHDLASDRERYQTVFASREGAVAAPTAGLHFTEPLLETLRTRGVAATRLTLHVGLGTFLPIVVDDPRDHDMHAEWFSVSERAAGEINDTRGAGNRVVAVGTTVVRALESAVDQAGAVTSREGATDLFITPPYPFRAVDALITNFHLPRSTLLLLVSAFTGVDLVRRAYAEAVRLRYRFYSYGDAMILL